MEKDTVLITDVSVAWNNLLRPHYIRTVYGSGIREDGFDTAQKKVSLGSETCFPAPFISIYHKLSMTER